MSEYEKMCQIQLELQKLKQQNVVVVVVVFLSHAYITKISHIIISKHSDKLYVHKIYLAFHWAPLLTTHRAESWRDNKIIFNFDSFHAASLSHAKLKRQYLSYC